MQNQVLAGALCIFEVIEIYDAASGVLTRFMISTGYQVSDKYTTQKRTPYAFRI